MMLLMMLRAFDALVIATVGQSLSRSPEELRPRRRSRLRLSTCQQTQEPLIGEGHGNKQ